MKKRILLLDDLDEQIQIFTKILQTANYRVIVTNEELQLLDLIESEYPDLILLSGGFVNKDIYLICKKIKLLEAGENIPIIFINDQQKPLDSETLFNSGGADYINYPLNSVEILTKITHQIRLQELENKLQEKTSQLQKLIPYYQKLKLALEKSQSELAHLSHKEEVHAYLDIKTFLKLLHKEWLRGSRQRSAYGGVADANISFLMVQINDFDAYERNHEPQLVKNCLQLVGEAITSVVKRPGDLVTSVEKSKFAILLPDTDQAGAKVVAEKMQENLEQLKIPHSYSQISDYISLSIGIVNGIPTYGLPPDILMETADNLLNQALASNKNKMIVMDYV